MSETTVILNNIAEEMGVECDQTETETAWIRRVIYSVCGRLMLSSLWDSSDGIVSVEHIKKRGSDILTAYQSLFPEIANDSNFGKNTKSIVETVYSLLLESGQMYHKANYCAPSQLEGSWLGGVVLVKGLYAYDQCRMSGVGPFITDGNLENVIRSQRDYSNIDTLLESFINSANWYEYDELEGDYEFLRTQTASDKKGYWIDNPDRPDGVNLMRQKNNSNGPRLYYFHKTKGGKDMISDLPYWISEKKRFTMLAIALRKYYGTLPSIKMIKSDTTAKIVLHYYLPPDEDILLRTYSWPKLFDGEDSPFNRTISIKLYDAIKQLFRNIGFYVEEE